jgi:ATP-dependent DNA helicase RecG
MPAAERRRAEEALASGAANVAVGTHALLDAKLQIPDLALAVVDEQQRLGVAQRLALARKGRRPHLLSLSATPIPRTLALVLRGELGSSVLRERPNGRLPVATTLVPSGERSTVVQQVKETVARGERVFWVVPRIDADDADEGDDTGIASLELRKAELREAVGAAVVAVVHGALRPSEKRAAMHDFREGRAAVLVATTVVEVGIDVPEATLVVVEEAERFGLAQLHQLRGRVGRGDRPGACVLLHRGAADRLVPLLRLTSGEDVAKADLEQRGAGELGGTRQHGLAEGGLVYLDAAEDAAWLGRIEEDARRIFDADPALSWPEHEVLRALSAKLTHALAVRDDAG